MRSPILFEDRGIELGKELRMEGFYGLFQVRLSNHKADVQQGCSLRDHADIDAIEGIEDTPSHTGCVADILSDETDDDLVVLDVHFGEFPKLGNDVIEARRIIDGERDAHFGSR